MRAVRLTEIGKPLEMHDVPIPSIGDRDVLVRVRAAAICHSDVHYRAGLSPVHPLPLTLGHEVAGVVEQAGVAVTNVHVGERVCLHYNIACGDCYYCSTGNEQFCESVRMLGHTTQGGYAEYIVVPARNALHLPEEIPFPQGATLMCASATAFHALHKARLAGGESVAVFGIGGLGFSTIQLAKAFGAMQVFAVDVKEVKLELAARHGAVPVNAAQVDAVEEIRRATGNSGVEVSIEMIGLPQTMHQAIQCLRPLGRAVLVGLAGRPLEIDTYRELLGKEAEVIGSNDHLLQELPTVIELARRKVLDTAAVVTRTIPLEAQAINAALDTLEGYGTEIRTVIIP